MSCDAYLRYSGESHPCEREAGHRGMHQFKSLIGELLWAAPVERSEDPTDAEIEVAIDAYGQCCMASQLHALGVYGEPRPRVPPTQKKRELLDLISRLKRSGRQEDFSPETP